MSDRLDALLRGEEVPDVKPNGAGHRVHDGDQDRDPWPPLERFEDRPPVPEFPISSLPIWTRDFCRELAELTQTPRDLAGVLVLTALSTACAAKARIEGKPGYTEPLNVWGVVALPPASRKSTVFGAVAAPIYQREKELAAEWRPRRARAEAEQKVAQKAADALLRKAGDNQDAAADALAQAKELEDRMPPCPRLLAADITAEKVAQLLSDQGGRLALWTPEGGELFEMMLGRYNARGRTNLEVFLKGHAGDPLQVDRMNRPPLFVERAHLTLAMTIQPQALEDLRAERDLGGRGLWGRFLFSVPENTVGSRSWNDAAPSETAAADYATHLGRLLDLRPGDRVARLHPDAAAMIRVLHDTLEPRLGPDGDLEEFGEFGGKLLGLVLRLAGLLHAADFADQPDPWESPIDTTTMRAALDLGEYALDHALVAWGRGCAPESTRKVWRWIARHASEDLGHFTRDAVRLGTKGGRIRSAEDLEEALQELIRRGYVREFGQEGQSTGRPAKYYEANPLALANGSRGIRGSSQT